MSVEFEDGELREGLRKVAERCRLDAGVLSELELGEAKLEAQLELI
jgi:hypothetical protein